MLIVPLSVLMGCGVSIGSVEPPKLESPPEEFLQDCKDPVLIPERELVQQETEDFWTIDKVNLIECRDWKKALQNFYETRDGRITNAE